MILERLKSSTASAHASLERRLYLARPQVALADYRNYLLAMHGFTAPLELRLRRLPPAFAEELELERRCKAELLRLDLAALEPRLDDPPPSSAWCSALPPSESTAQALGVLYVLEGSTLGARWLLRHLGPLGLEGCSAYLSSYGDALGSMWEKMRAVLVRHAEQAPERVPELLSAALATFRTLDDWFVQCGAAERRSDAWAS